MSSNSPSPARHFSDQVWHPTEYLRVLYKRRWIALPAFLLVFLSGTLNSIRTVPVYEARTQLLIERDSRRVTSLNSALEDRSMGYDDDFYPTQYRILQSRSLAQRTVQALEAAGVEPDLPPAPGFTFSISGVISAARSAVASLMPERESPRPAPAAPALDDPDTGKANAFLGGVSVVPVRSSRLVDLRYRSADPEYAARAVNELAKQYAQQSIEFRFLASQEASDWLRGQLEEQRVKVQASEAALQRFKETEDAVSVDERQNIVVQRLTELNAQVTRARIERINQEAMFNRLQEMQQAGQPLDAFPAVMTNEVVQGLKAEVNAMRSERAQMAARGLGDNFPDVRDLLTRLQAAEARLQTEIDRVAESVRNEYLAARARENSLVQALNSQQGEVLGLDRKSIEYAALEREAAGNRQLYENLLERANETGVSGEFRDSNVQVVDTAEVPRAPVLPRVQRDITMAALGGLVLALGLAFGFEFMDSRIKSPEEIRTQLGLPFLGLVPVAPKTEGNPEAWLLDGAAPSTFAESIRGIRTAVLFSSADEGARSVLVTSTGPGEGKTVISSNLAVSLAQAGQRTLVIDADMRRPRLHEALDRSQEPGLSNVLVGETSLDVAARLTGVPNLWVLTAGHIPPNPAELLGSKKFDALYQQLKQRFDWIVFDAPPVMAVTDAAVLSNRVGGVLFVVGAEMTTRQSAVAAIDQLSSARAKFVGAVLNRVNVKRHSFYYAPYYRKEYTKYHSTTAARG
ncbi:MAG: GumC family protein [Vicinamibacterales bacterium]